MRPVHEPSQIASATVSSPMTPVSRATTKSLSGLGITDVVFGSLVLVAVSPSTLWSGVGVDALRSEREPGGRGRLILVLVVLLSCTQCSFTRPTPPAVDTPSGRECVNRCDEDRTACPAGTSYVATGSSSDWRDGLIAFFGASLNWALARCPCMKALASCYASCRAREASDGSSQTSPDGTGRPPAASRGP